MEIVGNYFENVTEPEWLEKPVVGGIRAWQVMFLSLGGLATVVVALCCCIRLRVPRTKQQIEADHKRRRIAAKFRQQLEKIQDARMDTMSLKDALSLLHAECRINMEEKQPDSQRSSILSPQLDAPMENSYADAQRPEPQVFGTGSFVKFASKVTNINRLQSKTSAVPVSPTPSHSNMDF